MTAWAGAPAAVMRCARPTRPLCPEKLTPRPAAAAADFTRRAIVDSLIPKTELSSPAPLRIASNACTVDGVIATNSSPTFLVGLGAGDPYAAAAVNCELHVGPRKGGGFGTAQACIG